MYVHGLGEIFSGVTKTDTGPVRQGLSRKLGEYQKKGLHLDLAYTSNYVGVPLSSVARGAGRLESPIGLKKMQNTTFLVLLRPIFAPKIKIAPLPTELTSRS